jgi:membrane protein implicated in regulation of membrane protease activity
MSDKPIAGLLAAIVVAPLCLVCALGPAALAAAVGSVLAWLGGVGLPLIAVVLAIAGWLAWRAFRRPSPSREAAKARTGQPSAGGSEIERAQ